MSKLFAFLFLVVCVIAVQMATADESADISDDVYGDDSDRIHVNWGKVGKVVGQVGKVAAGAAAAAAFGGK